MIYKFSNPSSDSYGSWASPTLYIVCVRACTRACVCVRHGYWILRATVERKIRAMKFFRKEETARDGESYRKNISGAPVTFGFEMKKKSLNFC